MYVDPHVVRIQVAEENNRYVRDTFAQIGDGFLPPSPTSGLCPRLPPAGNHFLAAIPPDPPHEAIRRVSFGVCDLGRRDEELQVKGLSESEENTEIVVREAVGLVEKQESERERPGGLSSAQEVASRSRSVRMAIISAAPMPIASTVERRIEFASSQFVPEPRRISTCRCTYSWKSSKRYPPVRPPP